MVCSESPGAGAVTAVSARPQATSGPDPRTQPAAAGRSRAMIDAYGLRRPDLAEAQAAVERVCTDRAAAIWAALLQRAGLRGDETDEAALIRMIEAMTRLGDPVVALCARALAIRSTSFEHLAATQTIVRSAPE
jgi:hypothetical protein